MRFPALLLAVSPSFVFAETITAQIEPTQVIVYSQGAEVTRTGPVTLPAGVHDIIIPDLRPNRGRTQTPTVTLPGATFVSGTWQDVTPTPLPEPDTDAYKTAKANLTDAKDAVSALNDEIKTTSLAKAAAISQIEFLKALATSDTLPDGIETLRDLSRMIAAETLNAHNAIQQADILARTLAKDLPDLQKVVVDAQRAVDDLLPPSKEFAQLSLKVSVPEAITSDLSLTYIVLDAGWIPTYELRLATGDTSKLDIERSASVFQNSGERWNDVNLTLSTVALQEQPEPRPIHPKGLRISEPVPVAQLTLNSRSKSGFAADSEAILESAPVLEVASGTADLSGIAAQYNFEYPMSLDSTDDLTRISLGSLDFDAAIEARAIPLNNQTAFRMVTFTNDSGERLLPAPANLYVDGRLIADTYLGQIVPGAETEIGFGPIHGLRLTRTILDRNEGDRGIISRSNENTESVRIDVENLTEQDWNVTLLDRVPFTEQEDLEINWSAAPRPTTIDHEDRRGILHWDLNLAAASTQSITLETKITWPEGMELR